MRHTPTMNSQEYPPGSWLHASRGSRAVLSAREKQLLSRVEKELHRAVIRMREGVRVLCNIYVPPKI